MSSQEFGNKDVIGQGHYTAKISEPFHKDAKSKKEINPEAQNSSQENNENVEDNSNVVDASFNNIKEEAYHTPIQSEVHYKNDKSEAGRNKSNEERDKYINLNDFE